MVNRCTVWWDIPPPGNLAAVCLLNALGFIGGSQVPNETFVLMHFTVKIISLLCLYIVN